MQSRLRPRALVGGAGRPRVPEPGEHDAGHAPDSPAGAHLRERVHRAPAERPAVLPVRPARRARGGQSPWNVGIIATGGLSHFPELLLARVGETDTVFDRKLDPLDGARRARAAARPDGRRAAQDGQPRVPELDGAARRRHAGAGRRAATSASCPASTWPPWNGGSDEPLRDQQPALPPEEGPRPAGPLHPDPRAAIAEADLTDAERAAFVAGDMRKINELGGYLHLVMSIPKIGTHGGH